MYCAHINGESQLSLTKLLLNYGKQKRLKLIPELVTI